VWEKKLNALTEHLGDGSLEMGLPSLSIISLLCDFQQAFSHVGLNSTAMNLMRTKARTSG
jgi:hypothetical protein